MRAILFLFAFFISPLLFAQQAKDTAATATHETFKPAYQLRVGIQRLQAFMRQQPPPKRRQIAHFLDTRIAPFFDFETMARLTAGRFYANLNNVKQARMQAEIKHRLLTRLTEGLLSYQGQKIRFTPPRIGADRSSAYLSLFILNPGQYPARIDFRMHRKANNWVITDVAANGQSAIVHYRRELAQRFMHEMYQAMQAYPKY